MKPTKLGRSWRREGFTELIASGVLTAFATEGGSVIVQHVSTQPIVGRGSADPEYRVVLTDTDGSHVKSSGGGGRGNGAASVSTVTYKVDDLRSLARLGLAVLDLDGRKIVSAAASKVATEIGARTLPLPVIGESFDATLPTIGGGEVKLSDYHGKVVLLDCWASW